MIDRPDRPPSDISTVNDPDCAVAAAELVGRSLLDDDDCAAAVAEMLNREEEQAAAMAAIRQSLTVEAAVISALTDRIALNGVPATYRGTGFAGAPHPSIPKTETPISARPTAVAGHSNEGRYMNDSAFFLANGSDVNDVPSRRQIQKDRTSLFWNFVGSMFGSEPVHYEPADWRIEAMRRREARIATLNAPKPPTPRRKKDVHALDKRGHDGGEMSRSQRTAALAQPNEPNRISS
jgi:hypothetical protein